MKSLKPIGTRPGVMYSFCKVHKTSVENWPYFDQSLKVPIYKLMKFLVPIKKPLKTNELTVKYFFDLTEKKINNLDSLLVIWM